MRYSLKIVVLCAGLMSSTAFSQTPPAATGPGNSAVQTPNSPSPAAPVAGANSFTEAQAKARLESQGFTDVTDLKKDEQGVWRGKAKKGASAGDVSVDFQGNIVSR